MAKMLVLTLGYDQFALDIENVAIIAELARLPRVKQEGYSGPYYFQPEAKSAVERIEVAEVLEAVPQQELPAELRLAAE
jgi:predicted xylose isomerase-like sugar epimerase